MKTSSSLNGYGRYVLKEQIESSFIKHQTMHLRANPYSEECRTIFSQTGVHQLSPSPAQHAITELWRTCLPGNARNEAYPKVRADVTITEKASTRAFSWLKALTSAFTFKTQTLC